MKWFKLSAVVVIALVTLLYVNSVIYADELIDEESEMKVDLKVDGELDVDIDAKGSIDLDVDAKGPSRIQIDADDEVKLNLKASDESQIFASEQGNNNVNQISTDTIATYREGKNLDNGTSKLNSYLPIIAGAILILVLLTFFLVRIRRERSKTVN